MATLFLRGESPLPNLTQVLYKGFIRPAFFCFNPETAHNIAFSSLRIFNCTPFILSPFKPALVCNDERLKVKIGSLEFPNPIGLAAGFDKGADLLPLWDRFGFGFVETGTFTPKPQSGQDKPRLFRYPGQKALINRMGFNNPGADAIDNRFCGGKFKKRIPIGINIGKNKVTPQANAIEDYAYAFEKSFPHASYITINVSSPNTPGLRDLQQIESLKELLGKISNLNDELAQKTGGERKLVFLKLSPDLDDQSLADIARLCVDKNIGIIATNTTLDHASIQNQKDETGGLSGAPLKDRANQVLKSIAQEIKGKVPLVGVGGIFSAEDAYEKIGLGANLVQIYTAWIYQGPSFVKILNKGLLSLMKKDGFSTISEACGTRL